MGKRSERHRPAVYAGRFYPDDASALAQQVEGFLETVTPRAVRGVVMPHAGYLYSGAVAGQTISEVEVTKTVVILCPKHTRYGHETSLLQSGVWSLPGGELVVEQELAAHLSARLPGVEDDPLAHAYEHSIEVLLPFLRARRPDVRFVPIAMGYRSFRDCADFGEALGRALEEWPEEVLVVASSDMNHFEDEETTQHKDFLAIEQILEGRAEGLYDVCRREGISMCGVVPTTAMMIANEVRGGAETALIAHETSAKASGDRSRVVGYAGLVFA